MRTYVITAVVCVMVIVPGFSGAREGLTTRQGSCAAPGGGSSPVINDVTVGGVSIPAGDPSNLPAKGKLYYSISDNGGQGQLNGQDCLLTWQIDIRRSYSGTGPTNGKWSEIAGVGSSFLDHAIFAKVFGTYEDDPPVTDTTPVVITATLPDSGTYTRANAYWYTTTGKFNGNTPITWDGSKMTVSGFPAIYTHTPDYWPTGLASNFNPLTAPASTYDGSIGGPPDQPNNGFNDGGPFGEGGTVAQMFARGLSFSFNLRFSTQTLGKGSEEQRGSWFETVNTPRWTNNFSNQGGSPQLQLGMGNYHEYYSTENVATLNEGSLRAMLPDTWTVLAFGVTSASDPALIQGAIQVIRTEAGATIPTPATTTAVPGQGIIVDVGKVSFSTPNFTTKKNTTVKATLRGTKVAVTFKLTAAQAKRTITILGGSRKLRPIATVRGKKGTNTVLVKAIRNGGYAVKSGTTVVGSAVLGGGKGTGGKGTGGKGNGGKGNGGKGGGDCPKQSCKNG